MTLSAARSTSSSSPTTAPTSIRGRINNYDVLKVWGQQVWTVPEVVLSKGDHIFVSHLRLGREKNRVTLYDSEPIAKTDFPLKAWTDHQVVRQLMENYTNVHLSRLELAKVALEAVMSRHIRQAYPGDRTYALMGLMRIRPPIDRTDTSFQAFARMSFPQDNEGLIERVVCLLPKPEAPDWELMTDQYESSLWDINPFMQVCAVGENDTVLIDDARGCQIQWDSFARINTSRRGTFKRRFAAFVLRHMPLIMILSANLAHFSPLFGGVVLTLVLLFLVLPSPVLVWRFYGGKLWDVEPALFGIEGFVPVEVVEGMLFGVRMNRMRWSAFGSPLSRHEEGDVVHERMASGVGDWDEPLLQQTVDTYPVVPVSPCATCAACENGGSRFETCKYHETYISCQQRSSNKMGELKVRVTVPHTLAKDYRTNHMLTYPHPQVFTLVDTMNMEVTISTLYDHRRL